MNLRCPYCGAEWSREQEESARAPVCPQCRAVATVSEDVAPDVDDVPSARCRHCGEPLAPGAVLCTSCGTHCRTGVNVKALQAAGKVGRFGVALTVGLIAALAGGVLWALLAIWTETEYGWIAWVLGGLVGMAVRLTTRERSVRVGIAALLLAVLGLGIGKVLMTEYICRHHGILPVERAEAALALLEQRQNDDETTLLVADRMIAQGELPSLEELEALADGDGPEAEAAVDSLKKTMQEYRQRAMEKYQALAPAEREALLRDIQLDMMAQWYLEKYGEAEFQPKITTERLSAMVESETVSESELDKAMALYDREQKRMKELALKKLAAMPEVEFAAMETEMTAENTQMLRTFLDEFHRVFRMNVFTGLFSGMDILFFALALITAYQLAAREQLSESE